MIQIDVMIKYFFAFFAVVCVLTNNSISRSSSILEATFVSLLPIYVC
jgi:hypothetical protein